jgi:uncharacterized protein with FMN-binding domain
MKGALMSKHHYTRMSHLVQTLKKFSVSAFVVFTFIAYAVHERLISSQGVTSASARTPAPAPQQQPASRLAAPTAGLGALASAPPVAPAGPTAPPTDAPPATAAPSPAPATALGQYRDGQYTGPEVDAFYGLVQVQAQIQQGKITDIQFLEYPNDRRTSIRINNIAMPYLTSEAIQAQSAEVDLISGATLTSEAFVQSLQSALATAKTTS